MLSKIYLFSFANKTLQKGTLVNWLTHLISIISTLHTHTHTHTHIHTHTHTHIHTFTQKLSR